LAELEAIPEIGPFPKEPKTDTRAQRVLAALRKGRDKALTWLSGNPLVTPLARQIDSWTTRAVIDGLWKTNVPKYTLLWLSEPDAAQHQTSPGSPNARAALKSADRNLGLVINALKEKGILDRTDIFVVSDHGFSTVQRKCDVIKALKKGNLSAGKDFDNPGTGDVMVTSLGGTTFFYVFEHHEPTIRHLVEILQGSDFSGVIFARTEIEGTFPLSYVRLDWGTNAPDVVLSMRWSTNRNDWGAPGMLTTHGGKRGAGTHASLSPFDCHNTLIAAGPDFRAGFTSNVPSGNVDIAQGFFSEFRGYLEGGKVAPLAVASGSRMDFLKDMPTFNEAFGSNEYLWQLVRYAVVPKGTPADRKAYLAAAVQAAMKDPELIAEYRKQGVFFDPKLQNSKDLAADLNAYADVERQFYVKTGRLK